MLSDWSKTLAPHLKQSDAKLKAATCYSLVFTCTSGSFFKPQFTQVFLALEAFGVFALSSCCFLGKLDLLWFQL